MNYDNSSCVNISANKTPNVAETFSPFEILDVEMSFQLKVLRNFPSTIGGEKTLDKLREDVGKVVVDAIMKYYEEK